MGQYYRNAILSKEYKNRVNPVVATIRPYDMGSVANPHVLD